MPFDEPSGGLDSSAREWRAIREAQRSGGLPCLNADGIFGPIVGTARDRTLVIGQFGQSLDGRIATATGESKYINCCEGLDHLHRLRSLVDAVLIGVSTAVTDDPGLDVRRVEGDSPARVVIDPGGRVPAALRLFRDDGVRRIVVIGESATPSLPAGVEVIRLPLPEEGFAPHSIIAALADAGLRRILVEGGARTVSRFIDAGALDRLHLIVAPVLLGDGPTGICLTQERSLAERLRPLTRLFPLGGDVLFDCDFAGSRRRGEQVLMADIEA